VMRKDEHRSGSFKDYAPIELYESVASGSIPKEVHTVSTGNHAFAVANAAHRVNEIHGLSIKVIATMDKGAYPHKKDNVRSKGAIVREVNPYLFLKKGFPWNVINLIYRVMTYLHLMPKKSIRSYKEGEDVVNFEAEIKKDAMRIPHDNRYTARGYAVMVIEALKQMKTEGIDIENLHGDEIAALVPLGSGGLMRGWLELTALLDAPVYGVSTPPATSVFDSIRNGKALREEVPSDLSFKSDGILATTEETALRAIIQMGAGALLVRDKDAFMATALLASHGITVESTSGLPLAAAILHRDLFRETTHILIPLSSRHVHKSHKDEMQSLIDRPEEIEEYFRKRQKEVERALGEVPSNGHTKHKNNKILSKV